MHIEDYFDWEQLLDNFFDYMEIDPNKQVRFVACKLTGGATAWWNQLANPHREGRGPMRNWRRMKHLLSGHFLPTGFEQLLYMQYQQCRQGNRSVNECTEEFYRLSAHNNLKESDSQLIKRYVGGLHDPIQEKLSLKVIWSLSQAVNFACKAEEQ